MLAKTKEQESAYRMRVRGFSLNEISQKLGVSKSSASLWLRDVEFPATAQALISKKRFLARLKSSETHRSRTKQRLQEAMSFADGILGTERLNRSTMQIICALLYWCEGEKSKNDKSFSFMNSDPALVATFLYLFRKGFTLDERKLRVCLHLHDYHNQEKQLQFWSWVTNVPLSQFMRPYRKRHTARTVKNGYAGCASIRYYDVRIARQINAIARAFLKKYEG